MKIWLPLLLLALAGAGFVLWPDGAAGPLDGAEAQLEAEAEDERDAVDAELPEQRPTASTPAGGLLEAALGASESRELIAADPAEPEGEAHLKIQVLDQNGNPLPDAVAGVRGLASLDRDDLGGLREILFTVQGISRDGAVVTERSTDAAGEARIPAPVGEQLVVYARMPGHLIGFKLQEQLEIGDETDAGELSLAPGGVLEVRVSDEYGAPVADAAVVMAVRDENQTVSDELPIQFLSTDENGHAVFEHLSFREYRLEVAKHGYQHHRVEPVAITQRGDGLLDLALAHGVGLYGTVLRPDGGPAEGVVVTARARNRAHRPEGLTAALLGPEPEIVTDATGSFRFDGAHPGGEYDLHAQPERGLPARDRVTVGEEVILRLPETAFLTGQVVDAEGDPVDGTSFGLGQVVESRRRGRPLQRTDRTDADGRFELMVPPGKYRWWARHRYGEAFGHEPLTLQGEWDLGQIVLEDGGAIALTFRDPAGDPVRRVRFSSMRRVDPGAEAEPPELQAARRPERNDNPMRVRGLSAGIYEVQARVEDYLVPLSVVQVLPGQTAEVDVSLAPAGLLNLTVRRADGSPFSGPLRLERVDPLPPEWAKLRSSHRVRTNQEGRGQVDDLVPGTYRIRVDSRRQPWLESFTLNAGEQAREIQLPAGGG